MEDFSNNVRVDRMIRALEHSINDNSELNNKRLELFVDKTVNILTGALSSIFSASIVSIIKDENQIPNNVICYLLIFLALTLLVWGILVKWILPAFYKHFPPKYSLDITAEDVDKKVDRFNNEIVYEAVEIYDLINLAKQSKDFLYKKLNIIISLFKLQKIVDFLYSCFVENKYNIRRDQNAISHVFLRDSFNIYTVAIILEIVDRTITTMETILDELDKEKSTAYNFFNDDYLKIVNNFENVKKEINL